MSAAQSYAIYHSALRLDKDGELGVAASSTNTYYSDKIGHNGAHVAGVHLETTGNLTGTFTLWVSSRVNPSEADDTHWVQDTTPTFTNPAAGVTKQHQHIGNNGARWVRIKYVNASGTGNVLGWACVKANG